VFSKITVLFIIFLVSAAPELFSQNTVPPRQETLVVTGVPEPVPLEEVDRAVTVIDLRQSPELYRSWADYVYVEPSLDLQQRAPNGVQADLSIRGSSFGQTLVLINGFRVNDAQTGHHNLDVPLPMDALQRIEVLRGAGSTLYGSDAVGGAINFIVAPPLVSELRLGTGFGNFGSNEQHASAAYASQRWSEQLSAARDFSTGFAPDRDYRNLALASDTRFRSALGWSTLLLAYGDRPFGANGFYGPYNSWERTKAWFAALSQQIGERTEVAFGFRRHTDNFILLRDQPQVYANNHETGSWQAAVRRRQPLRQNTTLFYGAEGYRDAIDSNNLGSHARGRGAGYVNFDVRAWHRFSFSAGVREEFGAYGSQLSPTASGGLWLSSKLKLRANVSHAFRVPTYTELYYHDPVTVGNPNLRPESAWNYEGGADWHLTAKLAAAVTVFHRRERNDIDYALLNPASTIYYALNIDQLNFTGVETALRVQVFRNQQLQFAYTGISNVQLGNLITRYSGNYPTQNGVFSWIGTLPGKFVARSRIGGVRRRLEDPYVLWDVSAMRRFGRLSPYLQLTNVANSSYYEIPGIIMPGRSVMGGMEVVLSAKPK
jgi:iron complex outermembrane receptor protein